MKTIRNSKAFVLTVSAACLLSLTMSSAHTALSAPTIQDAGKAPMITVTDITGREFSLAENVAAGKPTVIYFMASWCPICATNWPALSQVVPRYEGKVEFIAISIDPTDTVDVLTELAARENFRFRSSPGNVDAMMQFKVTAQTAKFAIDGSGNIVYRHDGALTEAEWDNIFAQLSDG